MRAFLFALVAAMLIGAAGAAGWGWRESYVTVTRARVQLGPRTLAVLVDRGRAGVLLARRAFAGPAAATWDRLPVAGGDTPDLVCDRNAFGFGLDQLVRPGGLTPAERSLLLDGDEGPRWRARRLVLPMWAVLAAAVGTFLVWWLRFNLPLYRELGGRCRKCGYDVSRSSHFCPACRKPLPKRSWSGATRPA